MSDVSVRPQTLFLILSEPVVFDTVCCDLIQIRVPNRKTVQQAKCLDHFIEI